MTTHSLLTPTRLLMGTRVGDMDPAVALHLQNELGLTVKETDTLLNKKSGVEQGIGVWRRIRVWDSDWSRGQNLKAVPDLKE